MAKIRNTLLLGTVVFIFLGFLEYKGLIWHNSLFALRYNVKGLDVSHYQGDIDWTTVENRNEVKFVYIKATEGNDFIDNKFAYNWEEARKHGILTGGYHFFSMRSSGKDQAENFINTVPKQKDSLPPVIDIEIPLSHNRDRVRQELRNLLNLLEQHYEKKPVLYVTYDTFNTYVKGDFKEFNIWIRDIVKYPILENREWLFWQYGNRGRIDGIASYVDVNVFNGSLEDLKRLSSY